jgi:hypothetical protein
VTEDEVWAALLRHHRETFMPDFERIMTDALGTLDSRFDDINRHFDAIHQRFDRLEAHYRSASPEKRPVE